jgi:hypothetical protein
MTDCYRILGVSPHASPDEIRVAYIAKMKVLHPDAGASGGGKAKAGASEITAAYWQLRDSDRRSQHDRHVFASTALAERKPPPVPPRRRLLPVINRRPPRVRQRERTSRMLLGAAAGIVVLAFAAPAGLFWFAHLNPIEAARASAASLAEVPAPVRRPLDSAMRTAAAEDFAGVVRDFGLDGARTYSKRCLAELSARASMTMLDYCIAFDDAAARWERPSGCGVSKAALFADDQRSAIYREAARAIPEPMVRRAMLQEAEFFAGGGKAADPASLSMAEFSLR